MFVDKGDEVERIGCPSSAEARLLYPFFMGMNAHASTGEQAEASALQSSHPRI